MNICFTGHRPDSEGMGGYNLGDEQNIKIMDITYNLVEKLYHKYGDAKISAIVGGALGYDELALIACKELKGVIDIDIELAVPFKKWKGNWIQNAIDRYKVHEIYMDKITYVDMLDKYDSKNKAPIGEYAPIKMQLRNMYMVDNSDIVIACWNGDTKGGTYNCVQYAKRCNKKMIIINPVKYTVEFISNNK